MSGVEVAGFLLAAFPLAISALEHYRDAAEPLGIFWKIRREYKTWMHNLNFCRLAFEQNLEEFLLPLIADEDELQQLIADPGGPEWKNPELDERLRRRLPKSYDLYLESISRIKDVMDELNGVLGIHNASQVSEDEAKLGGELSKTSVMSKANLDFQTWRVKMSLNQSKRDKLFKQLTDHNNELRTLLNSSDRIAELRQHRGGARKGSAHLKGLWQLWRHAGELYSLLMQSWRCECKTLHQTNLLLQHRASSKVEFRIMFVYALQNLKPKPWLWTCQETNVRMLDAEWQPKKSAVRFAPTCDNNIQSISSRAPSQVDSASTKISPFKRAVERLKRDRNKSDAHCTQSTDFPPKVSLAAPPTPEITFTDTSGPTPDVDGVDRDNVVNSLCDTIAKFCSNNANHSSSYLKGEQYRFVLSSLKSTDLGETVSLEGLLRKNSQIALTRRQRYLIALTLSSSYLQLHCTPWIRTHWCKKDILFLRDSTNLNRVFIDQPYISRNVTHVPDAAEPPYDSSLSNLGIMLLELCFGMALEDHEIRQKYPSNAVSNPFLDLAAALEWSSRAAEEAGPEFADAIMWCLRNNNDIPGRGETGTSENWREELYWKVVQPLKSCYDLFAGVARS